MNDISDRLLTEMIGYWKISPNNYTLSILIKRYGRSGDLSGAFKVVEEYPKRFGFSPNAHVWTCLISACVNRQRLGIAECIFRSMTGEFDRLRELLDAGAEAELTGGESERGSFRRLLFEARKCQPDVKTYETLINGLMRK